MAEEKTRLVDAGELRGLMERLLMAEGAEEEAAQRTAEVHWEAQLRGHTSHGVVRIPAILVKLRDGTTNAAAKPRVVREKEASALVDGDGGLGPFVSFFAAGLAVRKGSLAPMGGETGGGHKGFGLGLCIGLLAGPLVGAMTGRAASAVTSRGSGATREKLSSPWTPPPSAIRRFSPGPSARIWQRCGTPGRPAARRGFAFPASAASPSGSEG